MSRLTEIKALAQAIGRDIKSLFDKTDRLKSAAYLDAGLGDTDLTSNSRVYQLLSEVGSGGSNGIEVPSPTSSHQILESYVEGGELKLRWVYKIGATKELPLVLNLDMVHTERKYFNVIGKVDDVWSVYIDGRLFTDNTGYVDEYSSFSSRDDFITEEGLELSLSTYSTGNFNVVVHGLKSDINIGISSSGGEENSLEIVTIPTTITGLSTECLGLLIVPNFLPPNVTSLRGVFSGEITSISEGYRYWDVSKVTDFSEMLKNSTNNPDISNWDVSGAENMESMFENAIYFNRDIGAWNTSNVFNMSKMFYGASMFEYDISNWDVSSLIFAERMFFGTNYNADLSSWCTRKVYLLENDNFSTTMSLNHFPIWGTCPRNEDGNEGFSQITPFGFSQKDYTFQVTMGSEKSIRVLDVYLNNVLVVKNGVSRVPEIIAAIQEDRGESYGGVILPSLRNNYDSYLIYTDAETLSIQSDREEGHTQSTLSVASLPSVTELTFSTDWDVAVFSELPESFKSTYGMFSSVKGEVYGDFESWDTSRITDMTEMFYWKTLTYNLSNWCVTQITEEPYGFVYDMPEAKKPVWGTCPRGENLN